MLRKLQIPFALMIVFSLLLGACATPAALVAPAATAQVAAQATQAPAVPTAAPAATAAPVATAAPAEVKAPDAAALFAGLAKSLPADKGFGIVKASVVADELKSSTPPFLVDVREPTEVQKDGYIAGSINLPIRTLIRNLDKLPDPTAKIVVYCGSGHRGGLALAALKLLGYADVRNINGGLGGWKKANLAVVTGSVEPEAKAISKPVIADQAVYKMLDTFLSVLPENFYLITALKLGEALAGASAPTLIDVRTPDEWANDGYIKGAVNIPFSNFFTSLDKLPAKDKPIVVYCGSGARGAMVMMGLRLMGYQNVSNLAGGLNGWKAAKQPVVGWVDWTVAWDDFLSKLPDDFYNIKADVLNRTMASQAPFLLDVREPAEVAKDGFIAGSVNIPFRDVMKNLDKLPALDKPIVVYCAAGHRGAMAMAALRLLGYADVRNLAGGFAAWKKATFAIKTGAETAPVAGKAPDVDGARLKGLNAFFMSQPENFYLVMAADLEKELASDKKPAIIDVRQPDEFAKGFIAGSVNVPIRDLMKNLDKLPSDKAASIVVTCQSGHRGALGMMALRMTGYTNVRSLFNGINAWDAGKLPLTTK